MEPIYYLNKEGLATLVNQFLLKLKELSDKIGSGDIEIPKLDGYATEEYVNGKIGELREEIEQKNASIQSEIDGIKEMLKSLSQQDIDEIYQEAKENKEPTE